MDHVMERPGFINMAPDVPNNTWFFLLNTPPWKQNEMRNKYVYLVDKALNSFDDCVELL
jgi:acyl-CoA-binding protein